MLNDEKLNEELLSKIKIVSFTKVSCLLVDSFYKYGVSKEYVDQFLDELDLASMGLKIRYLITISNSDHYPYDLKFEYENYEDIPFGELVYDDDDNEYEIAEMYLSKLIVKLDRTDGVFVKKVSPKLS